MYIQFILQECLFAWQLYFILQETTSNTATRLQETRRRRLIGRSASRLFAVCMRCTGPSIGIGMWLVFNIFCGFPYLKTYFGIVFCREVFEIFFRLLLTGFLVLIGQGLSVQIFFGIFVSFVYVKCQEIFMPYKDRQLNIFKMITLWQIFFIFLIALVSFTDFF